MNEHVLSYTGFLYLPWVCAKKSMYLILILLLFYHMFCVNGPKLQVFNTQE